MASWRSPTAELAISRPSNDSTRDVHALLAELRSWSANVEPFRAQYQESVDDLDAYLDVIRNRYADAEAVYARAGQLAAVALDHYDPAVQAEGDISATAERLP